eukprot:gnl/MRDRNA2_/MRDRNA2_110201_c0_seq1.p1 gnl/MRDRNA2_/MRDRNA2_110201_c0~~gnl/MRDRNA2_/MRDRNA2_110201_c0_seq1.p1  ORF type:complete len:618 (+),score=94.58 gnl/MRDRNA2_/MRDRNA2_110201_c0_seq1:244-1854(+)
MTPKSYNGKRKQVKKFSAFATHYDYWDTVTRHLKSQEPQGLYEALQEDQPRCLYFDLDGRPELRGMHEDIVELLRYFVRWTLGGESLGWGVEDPIPVTLSSQDPNKYSCHVVFPQIQFANHKHMREFVEPILRTLPMLTIEEDGNPVPLLDLVVDRVPYMRFQLLRGPFACKLKDGLLRPDTCLRPDDEEYFRDNPLSCFAGYLEDDFKLPMLALDQLMESIPEVHEAELRTCNATARVNGSIASLSSDGDWTPSLNDMTLLYTEEFQMRNTIRSQDFSCKSPIEVYETALQMLHPARASQFWSWFRISGVTYSMLERYNDDSDAKDRIWQAHRNWSRSYHRYDDEENVDSVLRSSGKRVSGLQLLVKLAKWDNPDANIVGPLSPGLEKARIKTQKTAADKGIVSRNPELFRIDFQRPGTGRLNLAGRPDIEKFEVALKEINPDRAIHELSRKAIQNIAHGMLKRYKGQEHMVQRILNAHDEWCVLDSVYGHEARRTLLAKQDESPHDDPPADLSLLLQMLKHDNPEGKIKLNFVL